MEIPHNFSFENLFQEVKIYNFWYVVLSYFIASSFRNNLVDTYYM